MGDEVKRLIDEYPVESSDEPEDLLQSEMPFDENALSPEELGIVESCMRQISQTMENPAFIASVQKALEKKNSI